MSSTLEWEVARDNDLAVLLTWGAVDWVPPGPSLLVSVPHLQLTDLQGALSRP